MTPISAAEQFRAIAHLRWRLFINGFRRKGGTGELVARIIALPFVFILLFGIMSGAFGAGYFAASKHHLEFMAGAFWAIFALQIVLSINISPPGLSFDPAALDPLSAELSALPAGAACFWGCLVFRPLRGRVPYWLRRLASRSPSRA